MLKNHLALWLFVCRLGPCQLSANTQGYVITKIVFNGSDMPRSINTAQAVIALSSGESEFYALVKWSSAGLGAVSMLKDLGVDVSEVKKNGQAVLEVRLDASDGRGTAVRSWGGSDTLRRQRYGFKSPHKTARAKITKTPAASNPADLGTKHLDESSIQNVLHKLKVGLEFRCVQMCKKSRDNIQMFFISGRRR